MTLWLPSNDDFSTGCGRVDNNRVTRFFDDIYSTSRGTVDDIAVIRLQTRSSDVPISNETLGDGIMEALKLRAGAAFELHLNPKFL